jgi:hypothetical protein
MAEVREEAYLATPNPSHHTAPELAAQVGFRLPILSQGGLRRQVRKPMDTDTIRKHLAELQDRMERINNESQMIRHLIIGYEGLLRMADPAPPLLNGKTASAPAKKPQAARAASGRPSSRQKGSVSLSSAIVRVLQGAEGQPLHTSEIVRRAQAMGAVSEAEHPERVIDLILYGHRKRGKPVDRTGPLEWRWVGEAVPAKK